MFESLASCFAFRCSASLKMTTPFIEWVLTRLGEVKLHLDELFSPGPASEP